FILPSTYVLLSGNPLHKPLSLLSKSGFLLCFLSNLVFLNSAIILEQANTPYSIAERIFPFPSPLPFSETGHKPTLPVNPVMPKERIFLTADQWPVNIQLGMLFASHPDSKLDQEQGCVCSRFPFACEWPKLTYDP